MPKKSLSNLSDEELDALIAAKGPDAGGGEKKDLSSLSDEELDRRLADAKKGQGYNNPTSILDVAVAGPVARTAAGALYDTIEGSKSVKEALKDVGRSVTTPSSAPTAEQLAEKMGADNSNSRSFQLPIQGLKGYERTTTAKGVAPLLDMVLQAPALPAKAGSAAKGVLGMTKAAVPMAAKEALAAKLGDIAGVGADVAREYVKNPAASLGPLADEIRGFSPTIGGRVKASLKGAALGGGAGATVGLPGTGAKIGGAIGFASGDIPKAAVKGLDLLKVASPTSDPAVKSKLYEYVVAATAKVPQASRLSEGRSALAGRKDQDEDERLSEVNRLLKQGAK